MRSARRWRLQVSIAIIATAMLGRSSMLVSRQRPASTNIPAIKLTTVLQDVAATVAQDLSDLSAGPAPAARRPVDIATLSKSAQDAVRSNHLRINDAGEIQVYILMSGVTVERL